MNEEQRRLACAALLIEVAIIDNEFDADEFSALKTILKEQFDIPVQECDELIALAQSECEESTSMYQFTQLVNEQCSPEEKFELIRGMWAIAYADNEIDKYEEYVVRKAADLIHLSHSDFIRAKHMARPQAAAND